MKIGIICAAEAELAPLLPLIEGDTTSVKAMLTVHEGAIAGHEVMAVASGMAKVNAAIAAQVLISHYGVEAVLNVGTAGGMDPVLQLFDTVVATEVTHHDLDASILTADHPHLPSVCFPMDEHLLAAAKTAAAKLVREGSVHYGRMVTGEAFIADEGRQEINAAFAPLSTDMETAAIAQVCHANGVPCLAIRSITDTADHSGFGTFWENVAKAAVVSVELTVALLQEL